MGFNPVYHNDYRELGGKTNLVLLLDIKKVQVNIVKCMVSI